MKKLVYFSLLGIITSTIFGCGKDSETEQSQTEKVYSKVGVNKLTLNSFPSVNSFNEDWDDAITQGTHPDIFFKFTKSGTNEVLYGLSVDSRIENCRNSDLPRLWSVNGGGTFYTHSTLSQAIDIDFYDYDTFDSDDYMGTTTLKFSDYTSGSNKYPSSINLNQGGISIKLDLTWIE